jgi:hypothetical protein
VPDAIELFWWGVRVSLDASGTRTLLQALQNGSNAVAVLTAIDPELRSKVALALAVALVKIGAAVIEQADRAGGSRGVVIAHPWVGPVPGWVTARWT